MGFLERGGAESALAHPGNKLPLTQAEQTLKSVQSDIFSLHST